MMRKTYLSVIFVVALLLTAITWLEISNKTDDLIHPQVGPVTNQDDKESSSKSAEVGKVNKPLAEQSDAIEVRQQKIEFSRRFYSAKTGAEAQKIIDELYAFGLTKEAEEGQSVLAGMCQNRPGPTNFGPLKETVENLRKYCEGVFFSDDEYVDITAKFRNDWTSYSEELKKQYLGLSSKNERDEWMWDAIANATSWQDLELLKQLIHNLPQIDKFNRRGFNLGQDPRLFAGVQGRQLQIGALNLYQCELLANSYCGPNNIRTIENCFHTGLCQPGWSLQDFYAHTFSIVEWEQVDRILAFLRELQKKG